MTQMLERLQTLLEDEIERQRTILAVCQAQGDAARVGDIDYLEAKTAILIEMLQEASAAERERDRVVGQLATASGCPLATLSDLVAVAAEPYGSRLRHIQRQLLQVLAETRKVVHSNTVLFRGGLRIVTQTLRALDQATEPESATYDAAAGGARRLPRPAVIDQRG